MDSLPRNSRVGNTFWRPGLLAIAATIALGPAAARAAQPSGDRDVALQVIPTPQQLSCQGGLLPLVTKDRAAVVVTSEEPDRKEVLASRWIAKELAAGGGKPAEVVAGPGGIDPGDTGGGLQLVLATFGRKTQTLGRIAGLLDEADRELLGDADRCEQAYVIRCNNHLVAVVGGSAQGTLYGAMTLLQLFRGDGGSVVMPRVHVRDWPEFKYRMAENWTYAEGRAHRGRGWCYDWGDGKDNYLQRVTALFDRCLRYKINMICFSSGFDKTDWDASLFPLEKELNRLADERGIKLMVGGYGVTYRRRGNEERTRQLQDRIRDYVRQTEPRFLYIHHEDHGTYASTQLLWSRRSDECKRRWPSEQMAAADGAAGGLTHDYDAVCEAVFSVKNADSGYDAARDCLVALVSPSYTAAHEPDEVWDQQLQYWATVSKLLKHKKNVFLGFREQFLRGDNRRKRILEMSQALKTRDGGPGLFLFSVSPASLYEMGPLFAPVPAAMSKLNEGADVVYYMCGRIFQEPQILLNASHMWNTDSLGALAVPETAAQCYPFCNSPVYQARGTWTDHETPGIYGRGGFLELACRRLYGTQAGRQMEKVYELKAPLIAYAYMLFDRFGRRADWHWDWKPELERTREAIAHVEAALRAPDCRAESRPILERFRKCLEAGRHFAEIRLEFQELVVLAAEAARTPEALERKAAQVERRIQAMEAFLKDHFTYDWATPLGGDILTWNDHLADMRSVLAHNAESWIGEMLAQQAADREQVRGGVSPLVNGDMESSGGWKFVAVTGKDLEGYADGGYVQDKACSGKRSYRIVKREVKQDAESWLRWAYFGGLPVRASWGEIEQEIAVEPGRKYVVAFEVFANWNRIGARGYLEYAALVDGQTRWSLDGSCPRGWKKGGFFFVAESPKVRLTLRTSDVKFTGGWVRSMGDSWWDNVRVYAVSEGSPAEPTGKPPAAGR